jgi:DNA-binding response OmpR family regulator
MDTAQRWHVLLVEDDPDTVATVKEALAGANAVVEHADRVGRARELSHQRTFDAIVLDLGLPDGSGLDFAQELRERGDDIPVIMLTAQSGVPQRVAGLARGADDYICKPFASEELVERLRAVLRRSRPERSHVLRYAGVELDLLTREVRYRENSVNLSDREAALLAQFLRHPEEPISRDDLAQEVFGLSPEADTGVVNVYVNYLRNKLEHNLHQKRVIHTVRGTGYMLSAVEPGETAAAAQQRSY